MRSDIAGQFVIEINSAKPTLGDIWGGTFMDWVGRQRLVASMARPKGVSIAFQDMSEVVTPRA
jgi:hypothetical protein